MSTPSFKAYLYQTIVVTIVCCLMSGGFFVVYPQYYFSLFPLLVVFFMVSTFTVHYFLTDSAAHLTPQQYTTHFMVVMGCKIFIYFTILAFVGYNIPKNEVVYFALSFFVFYLIYTVLEVRSVLAYFRDTPSIPK